MNTPPTRAGHAALLRWLLVALVLALGVVLNSTQGLKLMMRVAVPTLEFSALQGTVLNGVTLENVRYRADALSLRAERLSVAWRVSLHAGLVLRTVSARQLVLEIATPAPARNAAWSGLPLPLRVDQLRIEGLAVSVGTRHLEFSELTAALEARGRWWTVSDVELRGTRQQLRGHARYDEAGLDARFAADVATARGNGQLDAHGELSLRGALAALAVEAQLQTPWLATLRGELDSTAAAPRFKGELSATLPTVGALTAELDGTVEAMQLRVQLPLASAAPALRNIDVEMQVQRHAAGANATLHWRLGDDATLQGDGHATLDDTGVSLALDSTAPIMRARARWLFADIAPRLGARLRWQDLVLPGITHGIVSHGAVKLRGGPQGLTVDGAARVNDARIGESRVHWRGFLDAQGFELAALRAELLAGELAAHGALEWQDGLCARVLFNFRALDVGQLDADFASRLEGVGRAHGCRVKQGWQGGLALEQVAGQWRGQQLSARGELEHNETGSALRHLSVALGSNALNADLELTPKLIGRFTVKAPDLAPLWPRLGGQLQAEGDVGGTLALPLLRAHLNGDDLRVGPWHAQRASGDVDIDAARVAASSLAITLDGLGHDDTALGALELHGTGTASAHEIKVSLKGSALSAEAHAAGTWQAPRWSGTLSALSLDDSRLGIWQLQGAVPLSLASDGMALGPACLAQRRAELCVNAPRWSAIGGTADIKLRNLPVSLARPWLPGSVTPRGTLNAALKLGHADGVWQGDGQAHIARGSVRYRAPGHEVEDLPLRDANATFHLDGERLRGNAEFKLGEWLRLRGTLDAGVASDAPLNGELSADLPNIAWLEAFWPEIAGSSGSAQINARLDGVRAAPRMHSTLRIASGSVLLPRFGTQFSAIDVSADGMPGGVLKLNGTATVGAGALTLSGEFNPDVGGAPRTELKLRGSELAILRLPDIEADAAPDMSVTLTPQAVDLAGLVRWSRVQIQLPSLPERAVVTSADEVLINGAAGDMTAPVRERWFIDTLAAELDFSLGDEVTLAAAGLDARLTGAVHWRKQRGEDRGHGLGGFNIVEGHYKAYGQDLKIQRGALIFDGAIDNPSLDVRAIRPELDVVAGVRVSGNLRVPKFALFAEPSLPDAEVLSYLVTGHALANASSGEAGVIARAALSLGADRAALVTSQLSNLFALDEFGINPGTTARTSSIVAGKRLTPKLTVRSEFNPFERVWSFFLNYKLSPRWSVEAQTGAGQGADVIYSVEQDKLQAPAIMGSSPAPLPPSP